MHVCKDLNTRSAQGVMDHRQAHNTNYITQHHRQRCAGAGVCMGPWATTKRMRPLLTSRIQTAAWMKALSLPVQLCKPHGPHRTGGQACEADRMHVYKDHNIDDRVMPALEVQTRHTRSKMPLTTLWRLVLSQKQSALQIDDDTCCTKLVASCGLHMTGATKLCIS
jgi:hypothetical protein